MIFVVGKAGSGKSACAERLVTELAGDGKKLYLATMIPFGEEGAARVKKHREMRRGKGFDTIERPCGLGEMKEELEAYADGVCLLECVANLAGNEMHAPGRRGWSVEKLAAFVTEEIAALAGRVRELVVVSDIFEASEGTDEETKEYIALVGRINSLLEARAERVIRI